ncbi:T9SS type A sorting domain-containing protein [Pedobacter arcticus]|uniref:T9SS type A sorting domain-containing protein n=1 Tax=Pedobacter arcticus TaxID=752140 RepID=UPI000378A4F9|nr:T9SS type A sorting domain-containing protein [Pedobacter arcticus]
MKIFYCLLILLVFAVKPTVYGQNLSNRNLFLVRIGDGSNLLTNNATPVYLDEYNVNGVLVKTIAMPIADFGDNKKLTLSGRYVYEGYPALSPDGQSVCILGYNAPVGTNMVGATSSSVINRTAGIVYANGSINTSTSLEDAFSSVNARGAVFDGNNGIWMTGGVSGVRYALLGASASTVVATVTGRAINVFDGQLFMSSTSGERRLTTVGPGVLPIGGQSVVNLPGYPITGSPCQFFLADVCNSTPGIDVLYVADNTSGILKYSLVNGTWVSNGKVGTASDLYVGLTGSAVNGSVVMYATRKSGTSDVGGGELVSITDSSGLNGTFSASPVVLATAQPNTVFRGVSYAFPNLPTESVLPISMASLNVFKQNQKAKITWSTYSEKGTSFFEIMRSQDGRSFDNIGFMPAAGNSNKVKTYSYIDQNPLMGINYYRLKQLDLDGKFSLSAVQSVKFDTEKDIVKIVCIDNYITEFLINMPDPNLATLRIYDMAGKLMDEDGIYLNAGFNKVKPMVNLASGVYVATITGNSGSARTKFIKQ